MISLDEFYLVCQSVFGYQPNEEQRQAIGAGPKDPLFIVAGPGTGKTAALTLRILKLVLVDGLPPGGILATTFTNKAAAELRSRILGWGFKLIEQLGEKLGDRAKRLDINQVLTGTIDSICERLLREYRGPGDQPPILVDEFVSKTLLLREGLLNNGRYQNPKLEEFLKKIRGASWGWNLGVKTDLLRSIWDRRYHDQVNWKDFLNSGPDDERMARTVVDEVLDAYQRALKDRQMVDFALLENEVLERLNKDQLAEFLDQLKAVFVDEYQDTNLLQERTYFQLVNHCDGALTVVGDDDQSLYRFRGATVELFSDFPERYEAYFKRQPRTIFLRTNYRSTKSIITFVNNYARLDKGYQSIRVAKKPDLAPGPNAEDGVPVLAMFRNDIETLSRDLASFIHQIFRGNGYKLPNRGRILRDPEGGDVGDCALLCSSPADYSASSKPRLPYLLRKALKALDPPIEVFNPRGQDLTGISIIAQFGGLLLECLDPGCRIQNSINGLPQQTLQTLKRWRAEAKKLLASDQDLGEYVDGWAKRDPRREGFVWPHSVAALDLVYALVYFLPQLHDDPEGQIYLEVFTRQLTACEEVGGFKGRVITAPENRELSDASVKELLRDFLGPIAGGSIKVNEDLMEAFPRDRLGILSIHQAKGLEFPLTIVDVGSDFKNNHRTHAFKRFPEDGGPPHRMEDVLRQYSPLRQPNRSAKDRAFDDLFRQFFVAYSRPQQVLLLVGLTATQPRGRVPNVATGWDRQKQCHWTGPPAFMEI